MSSDEQFFKDNDINPYKYLGVTKKSTKNQVKYAYKTKINDIKYTKIVLDRCYQYIMAIITEKEPKIEPEPVMDTMDLIDQHFSKINFDDAQTRKKMFVNNDLDFDNISNNFPDPLKREIVEQPQIFKDGESFSIDKFNSAFETNRQPTFKPVKMGAFKSKMSIKAQPIVCYGGIIMEKKKEKVHKFGSNIKSLEHYQDESLHDLKFIEAEGKLVEKRINDMKSQEQANRDYIMKNLHIYPADIRKQFLNGTLDSSSTYMGPTS